jgi:L-gulono-1,4-lactone dehydrogenase
MADGTGRWRNWAGNQQARPARVATPRSTGDVAAAVREAADDGLTVRMTGTGHSFTPVAVTDGLLLRPDGLRRVRSVDRDAGLATVEAGCPLRDLNTILAAQGLSLANMGDIQEQTAAGAIQTGTHGTGRSVASIAAQVAGLELVLADGTVRTCSRDKDRELFDAARVGLGALGVLTAVTFRVVPLFLLRAQEEPMSWAEVIGRLDELTARNDHFEFYWFPHTEGCLVKRNNRTDGPQRPLPAARYWLDDEFLSNTVFGLTCRIGHAFPGTIRTVNKIAGRALGTRGYVAPAYRVYTSPRRVRFTEQEYAVPRDDLTSVLAEIRKLFAQRDWQISFPIEVRVAPPDDLWLSTGYGRETAYVAVHMFHASDPRDYFRDVENVMTAAAGRPHWGKLHTRDADYLRERYPRFADFLAVRDKLDPDRRFGNPYLRQVLGS